MKNLKKINMMFTMFIMMFTFFYASKNVQAATVVNPTYIKDVAQNVTPTIYTATFPEGVTDASMSIRVPEKGTILIYALGTTDATLNINGCTRGYNLYIYKNENYKEKDYHFSNGGTYTLSITRSSYDAKEEGIVMFYTVFINGGETSINKKDTAVYYSQSYSDYAYTKIYVSSNGYIKVYTPESDKNSVYVTLLNNKKKAVSEEIYTNESKSYLNYFAVSKGTYYIRTRSASDNVYSVTYDFKKIKEKSGSKKSKAVNIAKGKKVQGLLTANGKNQTDWYKIKLTSKKKLKLEVISYNTDDDIKIQVIPNNNMRIIGDTIQLKSGNSVNKISSIDKFNPGVYYLKVTKNKKTASGYYQIKFKK